MKLMPVNSRQSTACPRRQVNSHWGFTLIELLMTMTVIGILATFVMLNFQGSQAKARDAERKSDLKQISQALELYFADYNKYPNASNGSIVGCPSPTGVCAWGASEFTDTKTTYFKTLPKDPKTNQNYFYRVVDSTNQKYQLFARLENLKDESCIGGDCSAPPVNYLCGSQSCNFAITSSNTTATE